MVSAVDCLLFLTDAEAGLTEAVKSLIDGAASAPLRSLTALLAEESGLLRRNLAGKRQDYSGRSVIVSGPDLKLHQCGLPYEMALVQFKPFIARKLVEIGEVADSSAALDRIDTDPRHPAVRKAAEQVVSERLVLLNRAPTLHRLGIQPFEPVLVDHRAIALHPLVCYGFNADFDGDQMAVHIPISENAQAEARELLDSAVNLASPSNGKPIAGPVQDMVTGLWYLTGPEVEGRGRRAEGRDAAPPRRAAADDRAASWSFRAPDRTSGAVTLERKSPPKKGDFLRSAAKNLLSLAGILRAAQNDRFVVVRRLGRHRGFLREDRVCAQEQQNQCQGRAFHVYRIRPEPLGVLREGTQQSID